VIDIGEIQGIEEIRGIGEKEVIQRIGRVKNSRRVTQGVGVKVIFLLFIFFKIRKKEIEKGVSREI
jgi:hypothetical protein